LQKPLFEFAADAWCLSFQRRVGEGVDRNRGSLPFHLLTTDDLTVRILVPLLAGEGFWIAWNLKPGLQLTGRTRDNVSVRILPLTNSKTNWSLYSVDALQERGDAGTADVDSFQPIDTEAQLEIEHLVFEVRDEGGATLKRVAIVIGTPSLYAHVTGLAAPIPSTSADAYGGWRLP
jgi:hypothetical protein